MPSVGECILETYINNEPIPVAVRSKVWVFGRWLTGIVGSNPTGGAWMFVLCLL
jgi:hypothetical protein